MYSRDKEYEKKVTITCDRCGKTAIRIGLDDRRIEARLFKNGWDFNYHRKKHKHVCMSCQTPREREIHKSHNPHLYPIYHNETWWYQKDCNPLFSSFYYDKCALLDDNFIYVGDHFSINPSGAGTDEY